MNLEQLKVQYHLHGSTHFRRHYGISQYKVYDALGYQPAKNGGKKDKIPDDGLSPKERRDLFYAVTGQEVRAEHRSLKDEVYKDTVQKVERFKEDYIAPEPYEGRFSFAFHKF